MPVSLLLSCLILVFYLVSLENGTLNAADLELEEFPIINDRNLKVELVFQGNFTFEPNQLSPVTDMIFSGQDIIILDKNIGSVRRIVNGTLIDESMLDVNVANERERGLLGITISTSPNENMQYVFLYYTESEKTDGSDTCQTTYSCLSNSGTLGNRLYKYELRGDKLINPKILLDLPSKPAPSHNGGAIIVGPDSSLFISVGDLVGSVNKSSSTKAQNFKNGTEPDGRAGILRISQDGSPVSNGILGKDFPLNLYYAYGIRNSFGIDFDPVSGNLWDTENGPEYGDEINLVKPGFNSGWMEVQGIWKPVASPLSDKDLIAGNKLSKPTNLTDFGGKGEYSPPEFIWKKTVGPTSLKFFDSDKWGNRYKNDLFIGSFNLGVIFHFELNQDRTELSLKGALEDKIADNDEQLKKVIFGQGFDRITDLEVGPDGHLYVLAYEMESVKIYRIVPRNV